MTPQNDRTTTDHPRMFGKIRGPFSQTEMLKERRRAGGKLSTRPIAAAGHGVSEKLLTSCAHATFTFNAAHPPLRPGTFTVTVESAQGQRRRCVFGEPLQERFNPVAESLAKTHMAAARRASSALSLMKVSSRMYPYFRKCIPAFARHFSWKFPGKFAFSSPLHRSESRRTQRMWS